MEEAALHGDAVGVEIGDLRPRFAELEEHLLRHGRVRHWSEWWHQYVELPLGDSDHDTYRQVMLLIGSLFRRLAPGDPHRLRVDEDRERHMWTRIREHLAATGTDPSDGLYVCGAFHAASRVEEFGVHGSGGFRISPRTATVWQHGLIPSSHAAIEAQFGLAPGSVSIAATEWTKNLKRTGVRPFRLKGQAGAGKRSRRRRRPRTRGAPARFPRGPRTPTACPASCGGRPSWTTWTRRSCSAGRWTSCGRPDATATWRRPRTPSRCSRRRFCWPGCGTGPSPRRTTSRTRRSPASRRTACRAGRDVRRLVEIMMGGDRVGQVSYAALPPLARDVHDRLAPLNLRLRQRGVQRALLDIAGQAGAGAVLRRAVDTAPPAAARGGPADHG